MAHREVFAELTDADIDREDVRRGGLRAYVTRAWTILEPATAFIPNWHIDCLCEHLQAITDGHLRRVIFNVPPGACKSLLISVLWPTWHWTRFPADRFLTASYSDALSLRDALKSRRVIQSPWYRDIWGAVFQLTGDQNTKGRYENNQTGYRIATHVGGGTGERAKIRILDDPHNIEDVHSKAIREGAIEWVKQTWSEREADPSTSVDVVVMQRLHEQDVTGYLLKEVGGYEHVRIPMRYESSRKFQTVLGWTDPRTQDGELLWPARWTDPVVKEKEKRLGPLGTSGQLQQNPVPLEGHLVKKSWLRYFSMEVIHGQPFAILHTTEGDQRLALTDFRLFFTVDLAASLKTSADFTVVSVWALWPTKGILLWLDAVDERMEGPDQEALIGKLYAQYKPSLIGIEATSYQLTLIQALLRKGLPIHKLQADKDKVSRFIPSATMYQNGLIYHPTVATWLVRAEPQLLSFPNAAHDDFVDTVAYASRMIYFMTGIGEMPLEGY